MRLTIFTSAYTLGGAEKHAFLVADYFKNTLQLPTEFCVMERGSGELEAMCHKAGIPTRVLPAFKPVNQPFDYFTASKEAKKLAGFNADVIMSFNLTPNLLNAFLGKKAGAKCVVWTQQNVYDCNNLLDFQIEGLRNCDCYISNSQHGAEYIGQKFNLEKSKLFFIKNGFQKEVTIKHTPQQWWQKTGVRPEEFKAAMIANIREEKDHISLFKAWKKVVDHARLKSAEPILYLAGHMGPNTGSLHRMALEMDIYRNIRFLGPIDDPQGLYDSVDLCVFFSKIEGMPNSLVEAMLQKLPVVANNIPGNAEALGPLNKPYLAESNDPDGFAERIIRFMDNAELRKKVGEQSYAYAMEEYSFDRLGQSTYKVLTDCLSKAQTGKRAWL